MELYRGERRKRLSRKGIAIPIARLQRTAYSTPTAQRVPPLHQEASSHTVEVHIVYQTVPLLGADGPWRPMFENPQALLGCQHQVIVPT